jgi:hypothetical protein
MGEVPHMLGLTKEVVCGLQLQVHLHRLTCPMMEDGVLTLKPLHSMRREGSQLGVCVQTLMLLDYDSASVVVQVKQVPHVLSQVGEVEVKLQAGDVTHGLVALLPLRLLLITNQEECKWCVGANGEATLTQCHESHVRHLLDGVFNVIADDGSPKWCHGIKGYLHSDLTRSQAMDLKGMVAVSGNRAIIGESDKSAQELSWEPQVVSARGSEEAILTECTVGVVI